MRIQLGEAAFVEPPARADARDAQDGAFAVWWYRKCTLVNSSSSTPSLQRRGPLHIDIKYSRGNAAEQSAQKSATLVVSSSSSGSSLPHRTTAHACAMSGVLQRDQRQSAQGGAGANAARCVVLPSEAALQRGDERAWVAFLSQHRGEATAGAGAAASEGGQRV